MHSFILYQVFHDLPLPPLCFPSPCPLCSLATLALVQFPVSSKVPLLSWSLASNTLLPTVPPLPDFFREDFPITMSTRCSASIYIVLVSHLFLCALSSHHSIGHICKEYFCNFWLTSLHHSTGTQKPYLLCSPFKSSSFNTMPVLKYSKHSIFTEWVNELGF